MLNIVAGWVSILLGGVFGAVQGMFFFKGDWLGGYNSWKRRISRLGHVSFFEEFLNLLLEFFHRIFRFVFITHLKLTVKAFGIDATSTVKIS